MATLGYRGSCPKCGSARMEGESRRAQHRGECPDCGLFYEEGWLDQVARACEVSKAESAERVGKTARAKLTEQGWLLRDTMALRVGYIRKDETSRGHFHVINTWFDVPLCMVSRPTDIRIVRFTEAEAAAFCEEEWFLRDKAYF